jgi:hypothetical protein
MLFILYNASGRKSGRALRQELSKVYKKEILGGFPRRFDKVGKRQKSLSMIVNIGNTEDVDFKGRILNNQNMVRAASNKRSSRKIFSEKDIPSPKLFLRGSQVSRADLPVIGRTSYHKKGNGFWYCHSLQEVQRAVNSGATHFLQFIPGTREYRVHLFAKNRALDSDERSVEDYTSVKMVEKVWQGAGIPDPDLPQKNHDFGWVFLGQQGRREEELGVVRYAAKQAISALGIDFGAVDVMYRIRDKEPFVLEVNSAPSLADDNSNTCEVYARRILKICEPETKKE